LQSHKINDREEEEEEESFVFCSFPHITHWCPEAREREEEDSVNIPISLRGEDK